MGERVRTQLGSTLPTGERQGAPGPGHEAEAESMSMGIRELVLGWGGQPERDDDEERLAALRGGGFTNDAQSSRSNPVVP
jgi:hypothetical protein